MIDDAELQAEALDEVNELINNVVNNFLIVSKNPADLALISKLHPSILRDVHSIKGALGMIGFNEQMSSVHKAESILIEHSKGGLLAPHMVDFMIDYWCKFQDSLLNMDKVFFTSEIVNQCFSCLASGTTPPSCHDHHGEVSCRPSSRPSHVEQRPPEKVPLKEVSSKIIVIENSNELSSILSKNGKDFKSFGCINEVYVNVPLRSLKEIRLILINSSSLKTNPLLLLSVLNTLNTKIKCGFIYEDKKMLVRDLGEIDSIHSFCLLSKKHPDLESEILALTRMAEP